MLNYAVGNSVKVLCTIQILKRLLYEYSLMKNVLFTNVRILRLLHPTNVLAISISTSLKVQHFVNFNEVSSKTMPICLTGFSRDSIFLSNDRVTNGR
ncbi:hypothetical protein T06_16185 [Trichinella sp. T6]|nr:hypothetical protein T06_13042 [Trichinella sp. T6]KRX79805.1 hypothetical protein T06_16185 [Trichinella sp. T6]